MTTANGKATQEGIPGAENRVARSGAQHRVAKVSAQGSKVCSMGRLEGGARTHHIQLRGISRCSAGQQGGRNKRGTTQSLEECKTRDRGEAL